MLRKWLGKARHVASRVWIRFQVFWVPLSRKRKLVVGAGGIIGLAAAVLVVTFALQFANQRFFAPKPLSTPEQAMADNLKDYLANPPAANASKDEKAVYYRRLSVAQASDNNYAAAAAALAQQDKSKPGSLTYDDYKLLASYYHQAHNDQAALGAVAKARSVMPQTDDLADGYTVSIETATLNDMQQEYAK